MRTYEDRLNIFIKREQEKIKQLEKVLKTLSNKELDRQQRIIKQIENTNYSLMAYQTALIYYKEYKEVD